MPKISVIMSVYNDSKYLELAVESILGQSFSDFEFSFFRRKVSILPQENFNPISIS